MDKFEREMQKQMAKSMQSAADKVFRSAKGKSVDAIAKALEREFKNVGLTKLDKQKLKEWAQMIHDGTALKFG